MEQETYPKEHPSSGGWVHPSPTQQRTLFPEPADRVLTECGVSRDEVAQWHEMGWLSFDLEQIEKLDEPERWELFFVRNLVRSRLSNTQIDELLRQLSKPYAYDPERVAYHFKFGWVSPPTVVVEEIIEENLSEWISEKASEGETELHESVIAEIQEAIKEHET